MAWCSGVLAEGTGGHMSLPEKSFQRAPKQHWAASNEAGNSVVMLYFACHFPITLSKNE